MGSLTAIKDIPVPFLINFRNGRRLNTPFEYRAARFIKCVINSKLIIAILITDN